MRRKQCPAGYTDVGRTTPYGNSVRKNEICLVCGGVHRDNGSTLPCFEKLMLEKLSVDPIWLSDLVGKKLWCPGCPVQATTCHCRVLENGRNLVSHMDLPDGERALARTEPGFYIKLLSGRWCRVASVTTIPVPGISNLIDVLVEKTAITVLHEWANGPAFPHFQGHSEKQAELWMALAVRCVREGMKLVKQTQ